MYLEYIDVVPTLGKQYHLLSNYMPIPFYVACGTDLTVFQPMQSDLSGFQSDNCAVYGNNPFYLIHQKRTILYVILLIGYDGVWEIEGANTACNQCQCHEKEKFSPIYLITIKVIML